MTRIVELGKGVLRDIVTGLALIGTLATGITIMIALFYLAAYLVTLGPVTLVMFACVVVWMIGASIRGESI